MKLDLPKKYYHFLFMLNGLSVPTRYPDDLQKLRGEASAGSDVDILLISGDFKGKSIFKRLEMIKEAEISTIQKFMIPLDVIMMTPEEFEEGTSPVVEYAKNGKVVFAA